MIFSVSEYIEYLKQKEEEEREVNFQDRLIQSIMFDDAGDID